MGSHTLRICLALMIASALAFSISCKGADDDGAKDRGALSVVPLETGEKPIDREAEAQVGRYGEKRAIAVAQLNRGIAFAEANGVEKLIEVLKNPRDPRRNNFVSSNYYIWILKTDFKTNAIVVAHPINKAIENRDFFDIKDADGKLFIRDCVRIGAYKGHGWVSYKWAHPKTFRAEDKLTYIHRMGDYLLFDGFYLRD